MRFCAAFVHGHPLGVVPVFDFWEQGRGRDVDEGGGGVGGLVHGAPVVDYFEEEMLLVFRQRCLCRCGCGGVVDFQDSCEDHVGAGGGDDAAVCAPVEDCVVEFGRVEGW